MKITQLGLTAAQKERRRAYIGGSDAKIIVSGDDEAVIKLWRQKLGEVPDDDLSDNLSVMMGTWTEAFNVYWFEKHTGLIVSREGDHAVSPEHPFMAASLDGFVESKNALFEAKHVGGFEPFDEVVRRYQPQLQHGMMVTKASFTYLSVFVGSGKWELALVQADPFFQEALAEAEEAFWRHVVGATLPRPIAAVEPPKALSDMREVDLSASNSWASNAADWLSNKVAAKKFKDAEKSIKDAVESDVRRAHGKGIEAVRNKAGAISIKELKS